MMTEPLKTSLGRLRLTGFLEGCSWLLLLFIAMPFKYFGNDPTLVKLIGPVHGVLFILFIVVAVLAAIQYRWKFSRVLLVLAASVIPFGTFYIDNYILKAEKARLDQQG